MKILRARLNHATNSSSTHSIIAVDPGSVPPDSGHCNEFGWDFFTASSKESKNNYFSMILREALRTSVGDDIARIVTRDICGNTDDEGYVDHESVFGMPRAWNSEIVDLEFSKELHGFFLRKGIVILGGNDNSDEEHPLLTDENRINAPLDFMDGASVCRRDDQGHWTLFSPETGSKVRISLVDSEPPVHSTYPELIDVKITDFCAKGCAYCYQGSTTKGSHAKTEYIRALARDCGRMKVFEVAIGGGEPTAHPDFLEILDSFRRAGVTPSFSTRSLAWATDPKRSSRISDLCGSWAFSADSTVEIKEAESVARFMGIKMPVIHIVLGANPWYSTESLIEECAKRRLKMVLLGFKSVGRGDGFRKQDNSQWLQFVKGLKCNVSIDTSVAAAFSEELEEAQIPEWLLERKEGCHSMYVDAVSEEMGPSSFCSPSQMEVYRAGRGSAQIAEGLAKWSCENSPPGGS